MSSSLNVFLLDPAAARGLVGSGDERPLRLAADRLRDELASADDWFSCEIENGAPRAAEALRALVHGGPYSADRDHAFQYGYAYQRLCSLRGEFLDNSSFSPFRGAWLSAVDEGLAALGVAAVSVAKFGYRSGLPAGVPRSLDFPGCGEWTHEQCLAALAEFERAERDGAAPELEYDVAKAVADVRGWLRRTAEHPGLGVVGFVS
ncbi:DUF7691 family protein [Kitasatospora phosalacinea]|uniref:DUF7691 domain-containing protein n=1 Tax=Kitasatospora phosalacinea TaxID=2065 RepID=A0A9W6ULW9_9ACTN|nr:hypothetical protein [Kitasatospora phosalacinea]GLW54851.1 hypothetical protein Kpho01_28620 [Kitasatospora phosalacinea]